LDNPEENWGKQILVINFIIASTVEAYSFNKGASKVNISQEELNKYCEHLIVPEIEDKRAKDFPILASQCIKFLIIYRNLIPVEWHINILEKLCGFLTHESVVIRIYSA
jgi:hypothetical protein